MNTINDKLKFFKKFIFETSVIIIGISISFWLNNTQAKAENSRKEIQLLKAVQLNINEIEVYVLNREEKLTAENELMDYLSANWNNINYDSVTKVLLTGGNTKSFHNLFLDYREFHPPISEITSIIEDGSLALISNNEIKLKIISLLDNHLEFLNQNVSSEIALQQEFRIALLQSDNQEIKAILKTSQNELRERFYQEDDFTEKTRSELLAINKLNSGENYLSLKIRQRFFVMYYLDAFKSKLKELEEEVNAELALKHK
ncbi:MAG: hypothetical protein CMC19_01960 [Flavobacteriaceae bacterium]|nr:hypothetical protein [Flavobacteriaceae bacterium]OUX40431.1 MAG: hypothetical protein CBE25_00785 [Flavobacteriaceae bacterium TMED265]